MWMDLAVRSPNTFRRSHQRSHRPGPGEALCIAATRLSTRLQARCQVSIVRARFPTRASAQLSRSRSADTALSTGSQRVLSAYRQRPQRVWLGLWRSTQVCSAQELALHSLWQLAQRPVVVRAVLLGWCVRLRQRSDWTRLTMMVCSGYGGMAGYCQVCAVIRGHRPARQGGSARSRRCKRWIRLLCLLFINF